MKALFIFFSIIISIGVNAQYLNVTDVYFTDDPSTNGLPDDSLTPGQRLIVKFNFTNNLSGQQDLNVGDSITFGWSVLGTRIGTLGTRHWPNQMANGMSAKLYSHEDIPMPSDSCFSFEVCVWPLYNPYAPNTDSTKGGHCTTFKTLGCTGSGTTDIILISEDNKSNFYVSSRSLYYQFPTGSEGNRIELYNLTGKKVFSETVQDQGLVDLKHEINNGIYIMKASNNESEIIQKIFIE
ncbi:MAG: T9SS type A sorting domain-containing protein [Salibacteraceae bacterium]